jgi:hypothetical protein
VEYADHRRNREYDPGDQARQRASGNNTRGVVVPAIYHITHLANLASIVAAGELWSDAERIRRRHSHENVGLSVIKAMRLRRLVDCHPGTMVGEYVPFFLCPRSMMLYVLHRGNRPGLDYTDGQRPIVHLVADMESVVAWANKRNINWAFTNRNAATAYAEFFADLEQLDQINWDAVLATDFGDAQIKDGKQAEFLVHRQFPWELVDRIGVIDEAMAQQVRTALGDAERPLVEVRRDWYY